jgi:menaquinone reductase, multiheme cytochrome c subunit
MLKSARTRNLIIMLSTAGTALLVLFIVVRLYARGGVIQPIAYNHKVHIENAGLHCTDCHVHAMDMASATVPSLEVCQNCHSTEPVSKSPEELKVLKYVADKKEIPWIRIYKVPDHVYFSHRRHVTGGKLECAACHGNMNEQTKPVTTAFLPVKMVNCMNCHKQRKVSNDCLACHR